MKKLIVLGQSHELRAPVMQKEGDAEGTLQGGELVWYAGSSVYRYDFWSDTEYMLRFDMSEKAVDMSRMNGAPLLADHVRSIDRQVGVIENARIEGGRGKAGYKLASTPDADTIRQKIADGVIRQVSMEAVVLETKDVTPKNQRMKEFLATRWQPQAVALVPVGADAGAQLLSEESSEDIWLADGLYQPRQVSEPEVLADPYDFDAMRLLLHRKRLNFAA